MKKVNFDEKPIEIGPQKRTMIKIDSEISAELTETVLDKQKKVLNVLRFWLNSDPKPAKIEWIDLS